MPLYQFLDQRTGEVIERYSSVAERDNVPRHLKRVTVPRLLTVFGTSSDKIEPGTVFSSVPKAFKEYENTSGLSTKGIEEKVGFSRDHIRRVFNFLFLALALLGSVNAADITPGYNFLVNDRVTAAKLNSAAAGTIKGSFIHGQTYSGSISPGAELIFYDSVASQFYRSSLDNTFLNNTNLIVTKTPSSTPGTNWHLLMLDGTATRFFQVSAYDLLTTLLTNSAVLAVISNTASFSNLFQFGVTNLPIQTTAQPGDTFAIFDRTNGVVKQETLAVLAAAVANTSSNANTFVIRDIPLNLFPRKGTNFAHGLNGTNIVFLQGWIYCTNLAGDSSVGGYPYGKQMKFESVFATGGETPFFSYGCDSNNVWVNAAPTAQLRDTSGSYIAFNNTNWNIKIMAKTSFP